MITAKLKSSELLALPLLYEGRDYQLHLQTDSDYGRPVVIKSLKTETGDHAPERLANEYRQTSDLQLVGVRSARGKMMIDGRSALVLDYVEGKTLEQTHIKKRRSLMQNLEMAIAIAMVLEKMHSRHLIHRNLATSHILVSSPSLAVTLIGFGNSSLEGAPDQQETDISQCMLDYISPEQTGRTNLSVDHRADLYSFGALLYELFTGKPPFEAKGSAELVYAHLAQNPRPPHELNAQLPKVVSDMVVRLLAKKPNERYQSAFGIKSDLEAAVKQLQQTGRIGDMELAKNDYSSLFHLPDHLYGRETELELMRSAIRDADTGGVILVSGRAGSGKSALVESLRSYAAEQGTYFVAGSYESSKRHVPYAGLRQALNELINTILSQSSEQLEQWKRELLEVSGSGAGLLVDMLPRLKLVVGPQIAAPEVGPAQAHHRFHHLLLNFVHTSAREDRPLLLFLDNLQWADQASLQLLELLLSDIHSQPILFVAAFREDEVGPGHPFRDLLDSLISRDGKVKSLSLQALPFEETNQLIADALMVDSSVSSSLTHLVTEKTGGNILFVRQFLQTLHNKGLLVFDAESRHWVWDADAIRQRAVIGSVAELMAERVGDLPEDTSEILALAACIGISFSTQLLAVVAELPEPEVANRLKPALEVGFLQTEAQHGEPGKEPNKGSGTVFKFIHDRVRQAVYELLPQKQRRLNHIRIGRLLLSDTPENLLVERVFNIVDQFNEGFEYLQNEEERDRLIALNLMAGRNARRAAAYLSAIRYLSMGIGLLPSDHWEIRAGTTLELFTEAVEAEYLSANYERAALLSREVLKHTNDIFTRSHIHELRILFLTAQSEEISAIESGMEALEELGITISEDLPALEQQELKELTSRVKSFERLPAMSDPRQLASLRILMQLAAPALRVNHRLLKSIIGKMVLLTVEHGNSPMAAFAYGWYGAILCGNAKSIEAGYSFGLLSLEVQRQFHSSELEPRVNLLFNAYVQHWKESVREGIFRLQEVFHWGLETGDLEYTSLGAVHHCGYLLVSGWPLAAVQQKQKWYLEILERWRLPFQGQLLRIWQQTASNLCGGNDDPTRLVGEFFDERKYVPGWIEQNRALSMFNVLSSRIMLQYIFGDYSAAVASGKQAEEYEVGVLGLYYRVNHSFYYALSLLALQETEKSANSSELLDLAQDHINRLRQWAAHAPTNFAHKLALVEAEHARARGNHGSAIEHFNHAVRLVRENDNLMDEAVISEREAMFYSAIGRDDIADVALRNALDSYRSWGAIRKVDELVCSFRSPIHRESQLIDTAAILKASHALSQEVHLEQLLDKLMRIVISNAGAEKGILIQKSAAGLLIHARAVGSDVEIMQEAPVDSSGEVAHSVVNYVARTQREVVLSDATRDPTFRGDKYITEHKVRSLLCLPIVFQGELYGLLYLENNLASDVFSKNRLELLKALASQAAISMENINLYTELENNINALRESEQKFHAIFDQTFQFIGVLDTKGTLLEANQSALQFAGVGEDEVLGKPFWEGPWWGHSEELQQRLKQAVHDASNGDLVRFEATHVSPEGNVRYIDFSLKPVTDSQGRVVQLIPEGRDITELKQAEKDVMLMSFALDNVREAAFLIDKNSRFRFVNEGACLALGYSREELLNMSVADVDPDWPEERWEEHWRELQAKGSMVFEGQHRTKDGVVFPVEISANYFQYGQQDFNLALVRDITERKQVEDEVKRYSDSLEDMVQRRTEDLRLARDAADTANKAKSTFLANMSHELRTPLNAILGFSHMMQQDSSVSESQRQNLDIINNSGEHLLKLINDVLEIAKIEAGKQQLDTATFDLQALVREVSEMMQLRAGQKGVELKLEQSSGFPRYIKGDEARLRQILVNLVGNAVKFTDKGEVVIRLAIKDNAVHHLLLEVEDSGPGISAEDQDNLFQPFVQMPEGKMQGGTGLGLSIVQQFVRLMNGTISVESELGKGSLFRVELPLDEAEEEDVIYLCEQSHGDVIGLVPGQPTYRILIAEDQYDNQLLLVKLMTDIGMEVRTASDGGECIRIFKEWKPDLIWMDRRMPVLDGVEATKRIRKLPKGDEVKIVAVTASAFKEQKEELMASKMDGFVSKPYRFNEIYDCLQSQLGLKFLYSDENHGTQGVSATLNPEMLVGVGEELCTALGEAIDALDNRRIEEIIRRIGEKDRPLALILSRLADNYDYPTILNVLDSADSAKEDLP